MCEKIKNEYEKPLNGVCIDNKQIIKDIIEDWKYPNKNFIGIPKYTCQLVNESLLFYNVTFSSDLKHVKTGHGNFAFKIQDLIKYEEYFQPLTCTKITVNSIPDARRLKMAITNNKGYIPVYGIGSQFDWEIYDKNMLVKRENILLPINATIDFKDIILNDFNGLDIKILEFSKDKKSDSIIVEIMTQGLVQIPDKYRLVENLIDHNRISFLIFDFPVEKIKDIANSNNIILGEIQNIQLQSFDNYNNL